MSPPVAESSKEDQLAGAQQKITLESSSSQFVGWYRYTQWDYGFSFAFPSDWEVTNELDHFIFISPQTNPTIQLVIGFRSQDEKVIIQRSGAPAGEEVSEGHVPFLDGEVEKIVLEYSEKNKAILYHYGMEIQDGDLFFTLSLDDTDQTNYDAVEIPVEIESTVDEILASFMRFEQP